MPPRRNLFAEMTAEDFDDFEQLHASTMASIEASMAKDKNIRIIRTASLVTLQVAPRAIRKASCKYPYCERHWRGIIETGEYRMKVETAAGVSTWYPNTGLVLDSGCREGNC